MTSDEVTKKVKSVPDIFEAVEQDNLRLVKQFVEEEGVSVASVNHRLRTPAHIAASKGSLRILKYVLEKDSSVLGEIDWHGHNVLLSAVDNDHLDIVRYLVENHVKDLHQRYKSYFGNTVIHRAAELGQLAILKYLVEERHGDVNVRNASKQPPVLLAAQNRHFHVVRYLAEEQNADLTLVDENERTILHVAIGNDDLTLLKYVLDERKVNLDINKKGKFGYTLVQRAAHLNRLEVLVYLIDKKHADVNTVNDWGETPLHSAARENYYEICKYLVEHGADTQMKDFHGRHPIQDTSDHRILECIIDAELKRNRRSLVNIEHPASSYPSPSLPHLFKDSLATVPFFNIVGSSGIGPTILPSFQNIFVIAKFFFIRSMRKSYSQNIQSGNPVLLSVCNILQNRLNPISSDFIQSSTLRTSKFDES